MSGRHLLASLSLLAVALVAAPVHAQDAAPRPPAVDRPRSADEPVEPGIIDDTDEADEAVAPAPKREPSFRPRVFALFGTQSFTAADSLSAVLGKSSGPTFGGGAGVLLGRHLFVDVSVSQFEADGSRVFLTASGERFDLGIPVTVTARPIDVSIGWRFTTRPKVGSTGRTPWRPVPFAGGGFGVLQYEETSEFADGSENVSDSFGSYHVLGGVELPFGRHISATADVLYRWVPDAIGSAGVSAHYGETDLGGAQVRVKVAFVF
ncbi:MAG: hypothetical protein IT182_01520 [Acidobacteria bacterium]|nr:hypothetical protein [Acidobacteriota bacterium]